MVPRVLFFCFLFSLSSHLVVGEPLAHEQTDATSSADGSQDACSFEALTQKCEFFNPMKPGNEFVELSDGTIIPNFASLMPSDPNLEGEARRSTNNAIIALEQSQSAMRKEMIAVFKEVFGDKLKGTSDYRIDELETANPNAWIKIFEESEEGDGPPDEFSELRRKLRENSDVEGWKKLKALADRARANQDQIAEIPRGYPMGNNHPLEGRLSRSIDSRKARVKELVEYAQKQLIQYMETRKKSAGEKGAAEYQALIDKLKRVHFNQNTNVPRFKSMCMGSVPNAFYIPADHSFYVCPKFYHLPDTAILSVVAHELGHILDPCNSQFPCFSCNPAKLNKLLDNGNPLPEIERSDGRFRVFSSLMSLGPAAQSTAMPFPLFSDEKDVEYFKKKGVLTEVSPGVKSDRYPFQDVYSCFEQPVQGGFRAIGADEVQRKAMQITRERIQSGSVSPEFDEVAETTALVGALTRYRDCMGLGSQSQMTEVMADYFSSKVLGDYLEKQGQKLKSPSEKLAPFAFFASTICAERFKVLSKARDRSLAGIVDENKEFLAQKQGPHPPSKARLEMILLKDAKIRKALGCEPIPGWCV